MNDQNIFGGKNPHGMYVPLTDDELEVLERLADAGEFKVVISGWGHVTGFARGRYGPEWHTNPVPLVTFGDKRITFYFRLNFSAPFTPQPNWYFDMEVHALGYNLFSQRLPTESGGNPIQVAAGLSLDLALDVAITNIDPEIVKTIKPKAIGLTTRHGNMRLDSHSRKVLAQLEAGEKRVRDIIVKEAQVATARHNKATGK